MKKENKRTEEEIIKDLRERGQGEAADLIEKLKDKPKVKTGEFITNSGSET